MLAVMFVMLMVRRGAVFVPGAMQRAWMSAGGPAAMMESGSLRSAAEMPGTTARAAAEMPGTSTPEVFATAMSTTTTPAEVPATASAVSAATMGFDIRAPHHQ